jgi:hypothetical protein
MFHAQEDLMSSEHPGWKQKAKHELKEMLLLSGYLAFFLCALSAYKLLLLRQYQVEEYWNFGFAIINALVITKVIMIGQYAKLGRMHEGKAIVVSAIWKSFVFSLLVFAFHIIEEVIKRLIHGADVEKASRGLRFEEFGSRALVVFCTFVPLFIFLEMRRVLGEESFLSLIFKRHAVVSNSQPSVRE